MLLDSLFHNLNDCESGTKEVLAYLDDIYPALVLGVNHGIMRTTSDSSIGHMQVYIHPGRESNKILVNDRGLVLETTRVGYRSLLPYTAGDILPVENFVARYYPDLVRDTLLEKKLPQPGKSAGEATKVVGVSGHPLRGDRQ